MINFVGMGRRFAQLASGLLMSGMLVACGGGGGNAGEPVFGENPGTTPSTLVDLSVVTDRSSVNNTGAETVTVTVTALAAGNAALTGSTVPISLAVDSGAVITAASKTTDTATGKLTATVTLTDKTNRTIKVTASSGNITKTTTFDVVDSVTGSKVADLAITLDRTSIPSNGTQSVRATVTTLDASRNAVGGSTVSFRVIDSGDAFVNTGGRTTTDPTTGQIAADISLGSNHTNRTIQVVATSGTVQRAVTFDVVDPVVNIPKASDLSIELNKVSIGNSGSETVLATVTAVDASRNVIAGIPVSFTVDNNAIISVGSAQTNAQGQTTASIVIGSDRSERLITVTARSETIVRTATFRVSGVTIKATALPAQPTAGSAGNKVEFRVVDVNQNAMVGVPIQVSATGGIAGASAVTDANGAYTFTYTAPVAPGDYKVTAVAGGKSLETDIKVPAPGGVVDPAVGPIRSASLTASPAVVRVNAAGTSNRVELRALFLGDNNNPIKNVRVRFRLIDTHSVGGKLASVDSSDKPILVYSDPSGTSVTSYSPGERASPTNGVTIAACYSTTDFDPQAATCPGAEMVTTLTVVSDPLSVSIGTDDTISNGPSGLTYIKKYVVLVVDAAGNPKADTQITPSLDLTGYYKGYYEWTGAIYERRYYTAPGVFAVGVAPVCMAEDENRNGVIDIDKNPDGTIKRNPDGSIFYTEDKNGNQQLDPRKSDASITMVGSTKTDANGVAVLQLEYPKSHAGWIGFTITAAAGGVLSPPAYLSSLLPIPVSVLKTEAPPPAFQVSGYGTRRIAGTTFCTNTD